MSTWIENEDGTRTLLHKTERYAPTPSEQPEPTESPAPPPPKLPRTKTPSEVVTDGNR